VPLAIVPTTIQGINDKGYYLYTTGWEKAVTIEWAPKWKSNLQLLLDTKWVNEADFKKIVETEMLPMQATVRGCNTFASCPTAGDIVQTNPPEGKVGTNNDGHPAHNPPPSSVPIDVVAEDEVFLEGPLLLGHFFHTPEDFAQPHTPEEGKFLVATSGDSIFRNAVRIVGLNKDATHLAESYTVQMGGKAFEGDICGFIRGSDAVYATGVGRLGAYMFALDPTTGNQLHGNSLFVAHPEYAQMVANPTFKPNPEIYPWPCRGIYLEKGDKKWVFALQFKGAGSLKTTQPHQLYAFDVTSFAADSIQGNDDVLYPIDSAGYGSMMIRGIAVDKGKHAIFLGEMSPSLHNETSGNTNKVIIAKLDDHGAVNGDPEIIVPEIPRYSDETCGGQLPYPAGFAIVPYNDKELLLFGMNTGIQVMEVVTNSETKTKNVLVALPKVPVKDWLPLVEGLPSPTRAHDTYKESLVVALGEWGHIDALDIEFIQESETEVDKMIYDRIAIQQSIPQTVKDIKEYLAINTFPKQKVEKSYQESSVSLQDLGDINLETFGQMFMQFEVTPQGDQWLAMPMCKTTDANSDFSLPYGAGFANADKNLTPIFATTGESLLPPLAQTTIDVNNDGVFDHAIELDYWYLKRWIRSFGSTLAIPPVVFTGPQMAISQHYVAVRGTGIQGNSETGAPEIPDELKGLTPFEMREKGVSDEQIKSISSSGLGQVQDIGIFSRATGKGLIFPQETVDGLKFDYNPFINGLSSNAGRGFGIWGLELGPWDVEFSTGAIMYLPPQEIVDE
jgi:hypothetical protein